MLAGMIVLDDQPFNFVNNVGFRRFMQAVEPRYSLPSDRHLRDVLLPDIYAAVNAKVVDIRYLSLSPQTPGQLQCRRSQ